MSTLPQYKAGKLASRVVGATPEDQSGRMMVQAGLQNQSALLNSEVAASGAAAHGAAQLFNAGMGVLDSAIGGFQQGVKQQAAKKQAVANAAATATNKAIVESNISMYGPMATSMLNEQSAKYAGDANGSKGFSTNYPFMSEDILNKISGDHLQALSAENYDAVRKGLEQHLGNHARGITEKLDSTANASAIKETEFQWKNAKTGFVNDAINKTPEQIEQDAAGMVKASLWLAPHPEESKYEMHGLISQSLVAMLDNKARKAPEDVFKFFGENTPAPLEGTPKNPSGLVAIAQPITPLMAATSYMSPDTLRAHLSKNIVGHGNKFNPPPPPPPVEGGAPLAGYANYPKQPSGQVPAPPVKMELPPNPILYAAAPTTQATSVAKEQTLETPPPAPHKLSSYIPDEGVNSVRDRLLETARKTMEGRNKADITSTKKQMLEFTKGVTAQVDDIVTGKPGTDRSTASGLIDDLRKRIDLLDQQPQDEFTQNTRNSLSNSIKQLQNWDESKQTEAERTAKEQEKTTKEAVTNAREGELSTIEASVELSRGNEKALEGLQTALAARVAGKAAEVQSGPTETNRKELEGLIKILKSVDTYKTSSQLALDKQAKAGVKAQSAAQKAAEKETYNTTLAETERGKLDDVKKAIGKMKNFNPTDENLNAVQKLHDEINRGLAEGWLRRGANATEAQNKYVQSLKSAEVTLVEHLTKMATPGTFGWGGRPDKLPMLQKLLEGASEEVQAIQNPTGSKSRQQMLDADHSGKLHDYLTRALNGSNNYKNGKRVYETIYDFPMNVWEKATDNVNKSMTVGDIE